MVRSNAVLVIFSRPLYYHIIMNQPPMALGDVLSDSLTGNIYHRCPYTGIFDEYGR